MNRRCLLRCIGKSSRPAGFRIVGLHVVWSWPAERRLDSQAGVTGSEETKCPHPHETLPGGQSYLSTCLLSFPYLSCLGILRIRTVFYLTFSSPVDPISAKPQAKTQGPLDLYGYTILVRILVLITSQLCFLCSLHHAMT